MSTCVSLVWSCLNRENSRYSMWIINIHLQVVDYRLEKVRRRRAYLTVFLYLIIVLIRIARVKDARRSKRKR